MKFEGKTALVTGGSRGIGAAVVKQLAREGAHVYVNYRRGKRDADKLASELAEEGLIVSLLPFDVADQQAVEDAMAQILSERGNIDLLVNNAGITRDAFVAMMPQDAWDQVLQTDLTAPFLTCRAAAKTMMRQQSGAIVNISSTTAVSGRPGQANYAAAKGGVIALTRTLALELAKYGIRANCVIPGFVETDMLKTLSPKHKKEYLGYIPNGRFGQPEEIANAVTFLLSDEASYIQGQTLTVDGGMIH